MTLDSAVSEQFLMKFMENSEEASVRVLKIKKDPETTKSFNGLIRCLLAGGYSFEINESKKYYRLYVKLPQWC